MTYEIEVRKVEPVLLAAVRRELRPSGVAAAWRPALDLVWAFVGQQDGLWDGGHNVFIYRTPPGGRDGLTVDFGVEVSRSFVAEPPVRPIEVPAGRAVTTLHVGPIEGLGRAYEAVDAWCADHSETKAGVTWETYGDWGADPAGNEVRVTCLLA